MSQRSASHSDPEHALAELQAEQSAVGHAEGGAGRFGEVAGQHGLGAVPRPGAAAELADVVEARSLQTVKQKGSSSAVKIKSQECSSFLSHRCPGRPPRRYWLRWAWRRRRRTSWCGCTGAGRPGTSTCRRQTAGDQIQSGLITKEKDLSKSLALN